jgi:DNA-binding transcriptional regulator YhcF (GntR family)
MRWNIRSDAPVYSQLVEHIKLAIVSGEFPLGSRLPSVRELAAEAGVNPNTMQRAFAELEREGLVLTQRTAGRTVTEDALRIEAVKRRLAAAAIQTFWVSMRLLGFDQSEALQMLAESGKKEREE